MKLRLIVSGALLTCAGAHAATTDTYAYAWPLQTSGESSAWQVELTPEVYAAVRADDLRDVEVVNAAGASVPTALRTLQRTSQSASESDLPLFVLPAAPKANSSGTDTLQLHIERDAQGRLRQIDTTQSTGSSAAAEGDLILDASALQDPLDSLWLNWDESAGATTAQYLVSGSDDLQQWRTLNASASVLAMQQGGNTLSRRQIALSGIHAKYLRLQRLDNGPALAGLRVRARTLTPSSLIQAARIWVDAQPQTESAADNTPAHFIYRLPAPLAVEALKLQPASDNSLARVRVSSRAHAQSKDDPWHARAEFTAFRLRQDDSVVGNDEITLTADGRAEEWRVDPATPLDHAPSLRVAFRPERLVFLAQGDGPYRLVAGSARAHRGDYPIDAALAQLRVKLGADWQPPLAALGTRATLQGEPALAPPPPQRDWKTWILWAVLVGAAALIGGLALSLLRGEKKES
jgi:hypothetical protein